METTGADAPGRRRDERDREPAERVEVAWAPRPGRDSADAEIVRRLEGWLAEGDEVTVVTSDRALAAQARRLGAAVEPASVFRARLSPERRSGDPG